MSLRIYSNPGNVIFPRPTVLRQYVPGRVSRQVRYTRSLSAPLGFEKEFAYAPWETSGRDFTSTLLVTNKRRNYTNSVYDTNSRDFLNDPLGTNQSELTKSLHESSRRNFICSPIENKKKELVIPLPETTQQDFTSSCLETKQRQLVPLSESKRRDFTHNHLGNYRRDFTTSHLENNRKDSYLDSYRRNFVNNHSGNNRPALTSSYFENRSKEPAYRQLENTRDFSSSCLENRRKELTHNKLENGLSSNGYLVNSRKDLTCNHLENGIKGLSDNYLENKRKDAVTNQNSKRDLSNSYLEKKERNHSSDELETKSKTLPETPRAMRWWHKDKNLCTIDDLLEIIREPTGHYELPTDPCNEVYPGVILSDGPTALCTSMLKRMGVSHVLNAAQGKERPGQVNTSPSFYSHSRIRFLGVEAFDHIAFRLYPYFEETSDFMQGALDSGGKVLVHCRAGISRSATLVCAFLMLKRHLSAQEAIRTVRKNRAIIPNDGFLQQLCDLNERLHRTRGP